jgi:hypothetical protein
MVCLLALHNVDPDALEDAGADMRRGGAMVEKHPAQGQVPTFKGSVLVISCETAEQAWEYLRKDIYATSDVWDLEKTTVTPMLSAFWPVQ